ncbi:MAG: 50S ribosomal protein L11 methyltransferase [Bacteroidales bacterium]
MDSIEVKFVLNPDHSINRQLLSYELTKLGYDAFWEEDSTFNAYISSGQFNLEDLKELQNELPEIELSFSYTSIKEQNWNALWESHFEPAIINDQLIVRAPFHTTPRHINYDIIIEPRMAFGTAHHETTAMILDMMCSMDLSGKQVLDMGSGTGVLSIMAAMKNAADIIAVDNDEWAVRNTEENIKRNQVKAKVMEGDVDMLKESAFDLILANINKNTLLEHIPFYKQMLKPHGQLIISGFYSEDLDSIQQRAQQYGIHLQHYNSKNNWIAARMGV